MLRSQEYVGLLIAAARRSLRQAVTARVRRLRLNPQQFWVLLALDELSGTSLGELATRQRVDAPTASRVVAALARRGLVRLALDPRDRRRSRIIVTVQGKNLLRTLRPIATGLREAIVQGMDASEQEALRASLRKVIANVQQFERTDRGRRPALSARQRSG
jgi:DNA-binding MarR family transcriptional regulator